MILASSGDATIWMPVQASTQAPDVDWLFYFITNISLFFFALIIVLMVYFCWKYRRREGVRASRITHNTPLELAWSILPSILLVFMFWYGFVGFIDARTPPAAAMEIGVVASQWSWAFVYPGGIIKNELHLPVDKPVQFAMESKDVLHSFFVPAFRVKFDIVPGRTTRVWVQPNRVGEYNLLCAEYCGTSHSDMRAKVVVHPPGDSKTPGSYEYWLERADVLSQLTEDQYKAFRADPPKFISDNKTVFTDLKLPHEMGADLFNGKGCKTCHTLDGSRLQGPTWKGIWGRQEALRGGGTATVNEGYVRESILDPGAKVVDTYDNIMPPQRGMVKERDIDMIIEYMKTLK